MTCFLEIKCSSCENGLVSRLSKSGICRNCYLIKYSLDPINKKRKSAVNRTWRRSNLDKWNKKSVEWQKANPERTKEIRKKTVSQPQNRYRIAKWRAPRRGIDWSIEYADYIKLIEKDCEYCGSKIPSAGCGLDRKDNNIGYHLNNVVPCCRTCNLIKSDRLTHDEMMVAMRAISAHRHENRLKLVVNDHL